MTIHVLHLMYLGFQCARWAHPGTAAILEAVATALDVVARRRIFEISQSDLGPINAAISPWVMMSCEPHPECDLGEQCDQGHALHVGNELLFDYARAGVGELRSLADSGSEEALKHMGYALHNVPRSLHFDSSNEAHFQVPFGVLRYFDRLSPEMKWWIGRLSNEDVLLLERRAARVRAEPPDG